MGRSHIDDIERGEPKFKWYMVKPFYRKVILGGNPTDMNSGEEVHTINSNILLY